MAVINFNARLTAPACDEADNPPQADAFRPRPEAMSLTALDRQPVVLYSEDEVVRWSGDEWCIKGLLPLKGVVCLYGEPGSCKSFLGVDMLAQLNRWTPDREEPQTYFGFRIARSCEALYVPFEGQGGVPRRIEAWRKHYDRPMGVKFVMHKWNLADPLRLNEFIQGLKEQAWGTGVIMLDTLLAGFVGINENTSEGMGVAIEAANRLAYELDCLVILVHHSGKDASKGSRGHSSLRGAVDVEIECRKYIGGGKHDREFVLTKVKEGESGHVVRFRVLPVSLPPDKDGDPRSSLVVAEQTANSSAEVRQQGQEALLAEELCVHDWVAQLNASDDHPQPSRRALESMRPAHVPHLSKDRLTGAINRLIDKQKIDLMGKGPKQWLRAVE